MHEGRYLTPNKLFAHAVRQAHKDEMHEGWSYYHGQESDATVGAFERRDDKTWFELRTVSAEPGRRAKMSVIHPFVTGPVPGTRPLYRMRYSGPVSAEPGRRAKMSVIHPFGTSSWFR